MSEGGKVKKGRRRGRGVKVRKGWSEGGGITGPTTIDW